MSAQRAIRMTEVGPRDGLQNEPVAISTAAKIAAASASAAVSAK